MISSFLFLKNYKIISLKMLHCKSKNAGLVSTYMLVDFKDETKKNFACLALQGNQTGSKLQITSKNYLE